MKGDYFARVSNPSTLAMNPLSRLLIFIGLTLTLAACTESTLERGTTSTDNAPFDQEVVVTPVGNEMRFTQTELRIPAGASIKLVMDNSETTAPAMFHNVVIVREEAQLDEVGRAGARAISTDYVPPNHEGVVAYTPMAAPGEVTEVVFNIAEPGTYYFVCTYPGHYLLMRGTLIVE